MFEKGDYVIYKNGDILEFGIIKDKYDAQNMERMRDNSDAAIYRVYYHTGDTSALTDERYLYKIDNGHMIAEMITKHLYNPNSQ